MIVGSGIVARSLAGIDVPGTTLFASGVSNSSCQDPSEFLREKDLILSMDRASKLVYFSTCSLSDGTDQNSYLRHKYEMETIINKYFDDRLILRLPTVVGVGGNRNNFFNFMSNSLRRGDTVYVQENLQRSLLDSRDIGHLIKDLVQYVTRETINVCLDNSETALQIVQKMKTAVGSESEIVKLSDKANRRIDNSHLKEILGVGFAEINSADYNERLIRKYLSI